MKQLLQIYQPVDELNMSNNKQAGQFYGYLKEHDFACVVQTTGPGCARKKSMLEMHQCKTFSFEKNVTNNLIFNTS